jgi:hypothetical protein
MLSTPATARPSYADARCQFGTHPTRINAGFARPIGGSLYQSLPIGPPNRWHVFGATHARLLALSAAGWPRSFGWYRGLAPDFFGPLT